MGSPTPHKHAAVYVYATRQDPPGNLAEQLITCLEQATEQMQPRITTYVDIQTEYKYNPRDALAYAVHFVFEKGESVSLARAFVRLLQDDTYSSELLFEVERHGIDPASIFNERSSQREKIAQILREYAERMEER
jgi:hypothetical protein